jgi:hypothetical protein
MEDDISNTESKKKVERIRAKNSSDRKAVDIKAPPKQTFGGCGRTFRSRPA